MRFLLDTDHITDHITFPGTPERAVDAVFILQLNLHAGDEITVSVIRFQEQLLGAHDRGLAKVSGNAEDLTPRPPLRPGEGAGG